MTTDLLPDARWRRRFRRQLRQWYRRHARDLPWRCTRDPYRIWVSEIMLQQTQVATVIPYFEQFVQSFPTISELAAATEEEVLRAWEGLGYYRRARQLHKAAQQIEAEWAGKFPDDAASVDNLPGIGRYTRGAILSIAFDQRRPILEANTIRLHSRLLAYRDEPTHTNGQKLLWRFAEDILPRKDIGTFNQALMELGGAICTPKSPRCLICPVASVCATRAAGLQDIIPIKKPKTQYEDLAETAVVVYRRGQVLLRKCQEGERWAGLWDFPRFVTEPEKAKRDQHLIHEVQRLTGFVVEPAEELATIKHGVTKYHITLTCRRAKCGTARPNNRCDLAWVEPGCLDTLPLSATGRKMADLIK